MKSDVQLRQQVNRLQLELNDVSTQLGGNQLQPPTLSSPFPTLTPVPAPTPPSAVNQIRNGEFGHSVDTWFNPPPGSPTMDVGKEAVWWFTNDPPIAGQSLDFSDARTNPNNHTLKAFINDGGQHSNYNPAYCDWDRAAGEARLTGDKTLDALLPNNRLVTPNRAVEYFGALIALRNSTIVVPADLRIFAGIWDNSASRLNWIVGTAFAISALVQGPAGTTERRYKVLAFTDRGYSYLSDEKTVLNAPDDNGFDTSDVALSWEAIPGILEYKIYRHDVAAGKFRLLSEIGSGANTYKDNGVVLNDDVGGYPSSTGDKPQAYVATQTDALSNLPVDGQPWISLFLNIPIPPDYDVKTTEGEQVLRIGMTKALDRQMFDGIVNNGSSNLKSDSGDFTALDVGRAVTVSDGTNELPTSISALVDQENVTLADVWPFANASDVSAYVVAGGDHGLLIDAAHLSYVSGSAFAPNPDDLNRLANGGQNPIAAPASSSQGGAGGGGGTGGGEGGVGCIALDCPVNVLVGNVIETLTWKAIHIGEVLFSGDLRPNYVMRKPKTRTLNLQLVRIRLNWLWDIELPCSPEQPVITNHLDVKGRSVQNLRKGDAVLISIDGHIQRRRITEIVDTKEAAEVGIFSLYPGHCFSAGRLRDRSWLRRLIGRVFKRPVVGVILHNLKESTAGQLLPL